MKKSFALCRLYRCKDGTNISLALIQQVHRGHTIHSTKLWPDLQREMCWRGRDHKKAFDLCVCLPVGRCCVRNASAVSGECECDEGEFLSLLYAELQPPSASRMFCASRTSCMVTLLCTSLTTWRNKQSQAQRPSEELDSTFCGHRTFPLAVQGVSHHSKGCLSWQQ